MIKLLKFLLIARMLWVVLKLVLTLGLLAGLFVSWKSGNVPDEIACGFMLILLHQEPRF